MRLRPGNTVDDETIGSLEDLDRTGRVRTESAVDRPRLEFERKQRVLDHEYSRRFSAVTMKNVAVNDKWGIWCRIKKSFAMIALTSSGPTLHLDQPMDLDRQITRSADPDRYDWLMSDWRLFGLLAGLSVAALLIAFLAAHALWTSIFG